MINNNIIEIKCNDTEVLLHSFDDISHIIKWTAQVSDKFHQIKNLVKNCLYITKFDTPIWYEIESLNTYGFIKKDDYVITDYDLKQSLLSLYNDKFNVNVKYVDNIPIGVCPIYVFSCKYTIELYINKNRLDIEVY